jgi:hypothetical protein
MTGPARRATALIAGAAGLLGGIGFVVSFARVSAAAAPSFGALALAVPVGIDLGILVFSAAALVLAYLEMPARWLRLVPWALTAATVYLNVAGETDPFAVVAHAVLPGLWVLSVAIGEHVVRHRLALDTGTRMDSVRISRWVLAPVPTLRLWRRMVLWETRSYPAALRRERDRLLALTDLQDAYGRIGWRWRAPRRARALYRLGELAPAVPASPADTASTGPAVIEDAPPIESQPADPVPVKPRTRRPAPSKTGRPAAARSIDDLRRELAAAIAAGRIDPRPSAEAIRRTLACSPSRARQLRDTPPTSAAVMSPAPLAAVQAAPRPTGPATATTAAATAHEATDRDPAEQEGAA